MSIEFLKAFSLGCWNGYVFGGSFLSHHHYFCGHPIALGTESAFVLEWSRNDLSGVSFSCVTCGKTPISSIAPIFFSSFCSFKVS
jgi:hypothetical protein